MIASPSKPQHDSIVAKVAKLFRTPFAFLSTSFVIFRTKVYFCKRFIARFMCLSILVLTPGCGPGTIAAADALAAAKLFIDSLILLEKASSLYRSHVTNTVQTTKDQLRDAQTTQPGNAVLSNIALNWEKRWESVAQQTRALEKKFEDVGEASDNYWEILERVTENIQEKSLRDAEKIKNKLAKERWDKAYAAAKIQINIAAVLRDRGNDVGRTMLAAALRGQLAEHTKTLDSITKEAEQLIASLETITEQGKSIVSSIPR